LGDLITRLAYVAAVKRPKLCGWNYTGWPKKVSHYRMIKKIVFHRIKACQRDQIYYQIKV